MNDVRGTPVSCSDPAQLDGYERALRSYQNYVGDPIATIDAVLSERDDFVLGHVFRSAVLMTAGERRVVSDAERSIRSAETLVGSANDREKGLTRATRLLVDGEWHAACAAYDAGLSNPKEVNSDLLRHTYVAYLVRQGARLADIGDIIGHIAPAAFREYGRLSPPGPGLPLERIDPVFPALRHSG